MLPSGPIHPRVQEELERSLIICGDCGRYIIGMRLVVCERCGAQVCEECSNSCDFCRAAGKLGGYCCECSNKELEECATCSCGRLACYDHCKKCESCHTVSCIDCQSQWPVTECGWCGRTLCNECGMSTSRFSTSDGRNYGICEKCLESYEGLYDGLKGLGKKASFDSSAYASWTVHKKPGRTNQTERLFGGVLYATGPLHPAVEKRLGLAKKFTLDQAMDKVINECLVPAIYSRKDIEVMHDVKFTDDEWEEMVNGFNNADTSYAMEGIWEVVDDLLRGMGKK